jgi:hypothetical protein
LKKYVCMLVFLFVLTGDRRGADAQFCEGTLFSNLIPGDTAIVVTDGLLNVRSEPSLTGDLLTQLELDTELPIISGPVCADQHAWYETRLDDDQTGWVAEAGSEEYWLGKLPRQYTTYERPADPNGTSPTVRFTYPEASIERIDFDSAYMHGALYSGEQIILRPLGGGSIFITAIPFADFEMTPGGGYDRAEVLRDLVDEWSDVALEWTYAYPNSQGEWPTIVVLKDLQEFQNGRGFSYIAAYVNRDELQPVDQDSFWYVFHGMTNDGAYFVNVTIPIQTPQLPEAPPRDPDDMTEYFAGYLPWIDEVRAFLLTQEAASFSPMLDMIKGIVYSLEIE